MKRTVIVFASAAVLLATLFFNVSRGEAAACYLASPVMGYVCDARPQPAQFVTPDPREDSILSRFTYSWIEDHAPLHAEPSLEAPLIGDAGVGFLYNTIQGAATDAEGNRWFKMMGGWTLSSNVHIVEGTPFTGMEINGRPSRPFGWMLDTWIPRPSPGGPLPPEEQRTFLERYDFVQIYDAAEGPDGWLWYDIGGGKWVKDNYLSIVDVTPRPDEVGEDEFWVDVDLTEQVFAAYEGDDIVYASLVSSGLDRWPTRPGLFQVWDRHISAPMSGGEVGDDFYNIEHVPHSMYFDGGISLHGAYWHNMFGRQRSHGCVNMPPRDAEWVFFWSENAPNDLWVQVQEKAPDHILMNFDDNATVAAPTLAD
ncbi:MAG: L,D-transpeptidase [Chloroflexota bacterium]